jgi:hypothetical protein
MALVQAVCGLAGVDPAEAMAYVDPAEVMA